MTQNKKPLRNFEESIGMILRNFESRRVQKVSYKKKRVYLNHTESPSFSKLYVSFLFKNTLDVIEFLKSMTYSMQHPVTTIPATSVQSNACWRAEGDHINMQELPPEFFVCVPIKKKPSTLNERRATFSVLALGHSVHWSNLLVVEQEELVCMMLEKELP